MLRVRGEARGERDVEPGDNHGEDAGGEDTQGEQSLGIRVITGY